LISICEHNYGNLSRHEALDSVRVLPALSAGGGGGGGGCTLGACAAHDHTIRSCAAAAAASAEARRSCTSQRSRNYVTRDTLGHRVAASRWTGHCTCCATSSDSFRSCINSRIEAAPRASGLKAVFEPRCIDQYSFVAYRDLRRTTPPLSATASMSTQRRGRGRPRPSRLRSALANGMST